MAVAGISATASTSGTSAGSGMSGINSNDFMKILLKQLQYQDPLEPMDSEQMVRQMSTIRELELNTRMSEKLELLTDQQRFGSAAALIGRHVKGTVSDGNGNIYEIEGVVSTVRFTEKGEAILELQSGEKLPLADLEEVSDAVAPPNAAA